MNRIIVDHDFYAGDRLMPAGTYTVTHDHLTGRVLLEDGSGLVTMLPVKGVRVTAPRESAEMDFVRDGERLVLHQVRIAEKDHVHVDDVIELEPANGK